MKLETSVLTLHPRHTFRISRGAKSVVENVLCHVDADGVRGTGEASPNAYYGESAASVRAALAGISTWLSGLSVRSAEDIQRAWSDVWPLLTPNRAAQCALDLALWDWLAKREGVSVCELVHGHMTRARPTFLTLGISTPEELDAKRTEVFGCPFIKMKSDAHGDLAPILETAKLSGARIAIDANCAWENIAAATITHPAIEFIEQPLPPALDARMPEWRGGSRLPIFADESCTTLESVPSLARRFDGINIKLVKCGGLTPALAMIESAQGLGLRTMIGCMLESSVLIGAGLVAAQHTDYADLDGAWLLADEPFNLVRYEHGMLYDTAGAS